MLLTWIDLLATGGERGIRSHIFNRYLGRAYHVLYHGNVSSCTAYEAAMNYLKIYYAIHKLML